MSAARAGLSPEDYRDREMFEEQKPAEIGPETDMDDALDRWSLTQLRQAAQERGIPPRGIAHSCCPDSATMPAPLTSDQKEDCELT